MIQAGKYGGRKVTPRPRYLHVRTMSRFGQG
nr:MAG TPA_asm: hypothetical protein [Caudoviricetes sp.]